MKFTPEQVIEMAREAGGVEAVVGEFVLTEADLTRLCTLAMSAGREQGLREAKEVVERERVVEPSSTGDDYAAYDEAITDCAAAIEQLRACGSAATPG